MMRIALVTETYPPEVNGVARTLRHLVEELRALGNRIEVVRPAQKADREARAVVRPSPDLLTRGLPLPAYGELQFGLPAGSVLRRRWASSRPDLVHVATEGPLGWSAVRTADRLGIPVSSGFHTNFDIYCGHYGMRAVGRLALRYLRAFHNRTRRTFVPSRHLLRRLEERGFRNLELLGRGVDSGLFGPHRRDAELRREWGAGEETPVAIYVGRLAAEKNLSLVAESYRAMRRVREDVRLVLVGDGPEHDKLERRHPEIRFAGLRRGEDLARHYASGDLFLFPSVTETFGNVVTEAMASGLLVLAFDYAAAAEHIETGRNGWKVPFGDRDAFARSAADLARSPERWPGMRRAARSTAEDLTWRTIATGFERDLTRMLHSNGPAGARTSTERA